MMQDAPDCHGRQRVADDHDAPLRHPDDLAQPGGVVGGRRPVDVPEEVDERADHAAHQDERSDSRVGADAVGEQQVRRREEREVGDARTGQHPALLRGREVALGGHAAPDELPAAAQVLHVGVGLEGDDVHPARGSEQRVAALVRGRHPQEVDGDAKAVAEQIPLGVGLEVQAGLLGGLGLGRLIGVLRIGGLIGSRGGRGQEQRGECDVKNAGRSHF